MILVNQEKLLFPYSSFGEKKEKVQSYLKIKFTVYLVGYWTLRLMVRHIFITLEFGMQDVFSM
jgi:hypothetical protein